LKIDRLKYFFSIVQKHQLKPNDPDPVSTRSLRSMSQNILFLLTTTVDVMKVVSIVHLLIHLTFISGYLLVCSLDHSFIQPFNDSFIYSIKHSFIHSFNHLFIHSINQSFSHSFSQAIIYLFNHSIIHSFTYLFINSCLNKNK